MFVHFSSLLFGAKIIFGCSIFHCEHLFLWFVVLIVVIVIWFIFREAFETIFVWRICIDWWHTSHLTYISTARCWIYKTVSICNVAPHKLNILWLPLDLSINEWTNSGLCKFWTSPKITRNSFCTFWPLEFRKAPNNGHAQLSKLSNMHNIFSHNYAAPLIVFTIQFSVHWCSSSFPSLSLLQSFTTARLSQLSFSYNLSKAFSQWFRIYDFDWSSLCDELLQWPIDLELAPGASLGVSWVVA